MGATISRSIQARVVALALVNHLAVEVRQPSLDVPGRHADQNLVSVTGRENLPLGAGGCKRGSAAGNPLVVAVDHDNQVGPLASLGPHSPKFDRESLSHVLLG